MQVFSKSYCPYCKKAKEALSSVLGGLPQDKVLVEEVSPCALACWLFLLKAS